MDPRQLREALPRTYGPFLARHGGPNAVQLEAAPPLLAGRDVLLCAPTASGKTEAVLAPLAERHCPRGAQGARLLVVSPTRALANDLHRRVRGPLEAAGIACGRWTGDHRDGGRLQAVAVLTPEALDGRLSRDRASLSGVRAVVLDELHQLDGTARGDQLRLLLQRLRALGRFQAVAASATVPRPAELAARYLVEPVVVAPELERGLSARIFTGEGPEAVAAVLGEALRAGHRKVLAFANGRARVEELAALLRGRTPFGSAVLAHHGSLSRAERLRVERQFLARPSAVCFATSTLELGVDIGDVDLVLLLGAPPSVSSLLQRAGRGGRRAGRARVYALAADPLEAVVFRAMLRAAARGDLLAPRYAFRPGILPQQAASLLNENPGGWVSAALLRSRLPRELRADWDEARLERLLRHLAGRDWLVALPGGRYVLGPRAEAAWRRGRLHANLVERAELEVRDAMTGDLIGHVARGEGAALALSGRSRQVLAADGKRLVTREARGGGGTRFGSAPRPPVPRPLARAILEELGLPAPSRVHLERGLALFHGLGSAEGRLLGELFRRAGHAPLSAGPLAVVLAAEPRSWPSAEGLEPALGRLADRLARPLGMGAHHPLLPPDERRAAVAAQLELDALRAFLAAGLPPEREHPLAERAAAW